MKLIWKYIIVILLPLLFFIKGKHPAEHISFQSFKFYPYTNSNAGQKITAWQFTVKIRGDQKNKNSYFRNGLPIHLMDENYTLLQRGIVKEGQVTFKINTAPGAHKLILLSPVTGNELQINTQSTHITFDVDDDMNMLRMDKLTALNSGR